MSRGVSLDTAWQALDRDDFRGAERAAREALARDRDDADAWYLLGSALLFEGRHADALAPLLEARGRDSRRGIGYRLGHCYFGLGELGKAEEALAHEVSIHPSYANAHNTLGVVLVTQGRHEEGVAAFQAALRAEPAHAEAASNLGNALAALGRNEQAIASLRRALEAQPEAPDARYNLGRLLASKGEYDEAIACFERALAAA